MSTVPTVHMTKKMKERQENCRFLKYLQIVLQYVEKGVVEASVPLLPSYQQHLDVAHGGLISTIADTAAGFAAISVTPEDQEVVTAELKISFLKPAKENTLRARGWVVKAGRNLHFCESEVWSGSTLVAKASATMAVISLGSLR